MEEYTTTHKNDYRLSQPWDNIAVTECSVVDAMLAVDQIIRLHLSSANLGQMRQTESELQLMTQYIPVLDGGSTLPKLTRDRPIMALND